MVKKKYLRDEACRQGNHYSRLVDEEYDTFFDTYWDFTRQAKVRWMSKHFHRLLKKDTIPWRVLEVGCGIGFSTIEFARNEINNLHSLLAIDTADKAIEIAEKSLKKEEAEIQKKVLFRTENFFDHHASSYHIIFMHEVFEHIPDCQEVFSHVRKLLYPGGLFMVSTPNINRLSNRFLKFVGKEPLLLDSFHIKEYSFEEMKKPKRGFKVVAATGRILIDDFAISMILSFGIKKIYHLLRLFLKNFTRNSIIYFAGRLIPAISSEIMIIFQKG